MSVNSYDNQTKTLTSVAGGTRVWIGTDSAHTSAVSGGTMPNNCMVYITDDTSEQISDTPTQGSTLPISSGGVYNTVTNPIKLINALFNPNTRRVGTGIRKFLDNGTNGNWTHTALVTGVYEFTAYKHNHGNTMTIYVNDIAVCSSPFWGTASDGTTSLEQTDISWSPVIYVKKGDAIRIESDNTRDQAKSRWFLNSYNIWGDNT